MSDLPLVLTRSIALRELGGVRARPLFITISGAHLYGFASPDSDFDVRGCHLQPLRDILSLRPGRETIELASVEDGREIDFVYRTRRDEMVGLAVKYQGNAGAAEMPRVAGIDRGILLTKQSTDFSRPSDPVIPVSVFLAALESSDACL